MTSDDLDTSPNVDVFQLIHEELRDLRTSLNKFDERLDKLEYILNSLSLSIELVQDQYQENGSAIASLQSTCRKRGEILSRLISKSSQPPGENEDIGGMNARRRSKT